MNISHMQSANPYLERARLLLNQKRPKDALAQLKSALEMQPNDGETLAMMGQCHYSLGEHEQGIEMVLSAIANEPENAFHYYLLGYGYYKTNKHREATNALNTSLSIFPYFAECYGLMAHMAIEEKNFAAGLDKANEGLAVDPENLTCLNARAIALNKQKKTAEAIETMQDALAQDPENEYTHCNVGWNYLEKGKHKTARHHFREALRIDPNLHSAQAGLKESLKSKIPPYKWMLQYSFWLNNQGKSMRWVIPIALYLIVRVTTALLKYQGGSENLIAIIVGLYLLFVITSWLIAPLANFFLLMSKDGKYALTTTERITSISVVGALCAGTAFLLTNLLLNLTPYWNEAFTIATIACWAMSVPLGNIEYPFSFTGHGTQNKISIVLAGLGLLALVLGFAYQPAAIVVGVAFLILFILNNWAGIFRR